MLSVANSLQQVAPATAPLLVCLHDFLHIYFTLAELLSAAVESFLPGSKDWADLQASTSFYCCCRKNDSIWPFLLSSKDYFRLVGKCISENQPFISFNGVRKFKESIVVLHSTTIWNEQQTRCHKKCDAKSQCFTNLVNTFVPTPPPCPTWHDTCTSFCSCILLYICRCSFQVQTGLNIFCIEVGNACQF